MNSAFWNGLDALPSSAAIRSDWDWYLGPASELVRPFLKPTSELSRSSPCRARPDCGCRHVVREAEGGLVAVCQCGNGGCRALQIEPEELVIYRLDIEALGAAARRALGFAEAISEPASGSPVALIGKWLPLQAPVYLSLARTAASARELERLASLQPGPFVLLTPTASIEAGQATVARHAGGIHLAMADFLEPEAGGSFRLVASPETILSSWAGRVMDLPGGGGALRGLQREMAAMRRQMIGAPPPKEPISDNVALQVFDVVKELETSGRWRKAPIVQVFRLYCLEGLSAEAVARRCGCAKSLVVLRLRALRQKLGRDPASLRACSAQFDEIEESLADPRARRISRKRAIYGVEAKADL